MIHETFPRAGDRVFHRPSRETWIVAYADPKTGILAWMGWPDGRAHVADCLLVYRTTDAEHRKEVARLLESVDQSRRDADSRPAAGWPRALGVSAMTLRGTATIMIKGVDSIRPTVMFVSCKGDLLYRRRQAEYEAYRVWTDRGANWRRVKREMRKAARAVRS